MSDENAYQILMDVAALQRLSHNLWSDTRSAAATMRHLC